MVSRNAIDIVVMPGLRGFELLERKLAEFGGEVKIASVVTSMCTPLMPEQTLLNDGVQVHLSGILSELHFSALREVISSYCKGAYICRVSVGTPYATPVFPIPFDDTDTCVIPEEHAPYADRWNPTVR